MPGVPTGLAEHHLRVDPEAKPVKKHLHRFAAEKRKATGEEVARLLATAFIHEIYHSEWLTNIVMVPKKDDSLRMCTDCEVRSFVLFGCVFRVPSDPTVWTR